MAKVLTLAQQKGGAGKTTLAAALAVALARDGRPVALVDLDPQRSLTRWAGLRAAAGAAPAIQCTESKDWRAAGDLRAARARLSAGGVVVVDCPGAEDRLLRTVFGAADLVLAPCQPSPVDVWATASVLAACAAERTPVRVVLNRVPPRGRATDDAVAALADAGATLCETRLGARVAHAQAFADGLSAQEAQPRSAAAAEIAALAAEAAALLRG